MRTIILTRKTSLCHIEAPGCIVNIHPSLADSDGRKVTRIDISADGDRYAGDPQWWVDAEAGNRGIGVRIVQTNEPAPANGAMRRLEIEQVRTLLAEMLDAAESADSKAPCWAEARRIIATTLVES